ncbi:MAG: 16S rRNA (uracil(1498)-N(3))-methyltransferase [Ilumatobacter sp.]|uniref:16S rRNA (uracil(1498)-N(3))-methyltransferase n=1 Tax=Ilumatobacter sp. TaxID=1967498 RepID=UPI003C793295
MSDTPTNDDLRSSATHVLIPDATGLDQAEIDVGADVEHHLRRVLRLRDGERVSVTDGAGRWRMCVVVMGSGFGLEATSEIVTAPDRVEFTIASAIPKGDRVDWLVQKTTELGADRVVLLHAERSAIKWKSERADKQIVRLQRIADEALRQSRRVWRCSVEGPVDAMGLIAGAAVAEPGGEPLTGNESLIAIGPEGGWSPDELGCAGRRVAIGENILRTETAAVAVTTLRMTLHH